MEKGSDVSLHNIHVDGVEIIVLIVSLMVALICAIAIAVQLLSMVQLVLISILHCFYYYENYYSVSVKSTGSANLSRFTFDNLWAT